MDQIGARPAAPSPVMLGWNFHPAAHAENITHFFSMNVREILDHTGRGGVIEVLEVDLCPHPFFKGQGVSSEIHSLWLDGDQHAVNRSPVGEGDASCDAA